MKKNLFYGSVVSSSSEDDVSDDGDEEFTLTNHNGSSSNESSHETDNEDDDQDSQRSSSNSCQLPSTSANANKQASQDIGWNDVVANPTSRFPCTARESIHYHIQPDKDNKIHPIDVYKLFIDDEVIDLIVKETNRYADKHIADQRVRRSSYLKNWKPVSSKCIKNFLGIIILMGLNKQPTYDCYWSRSKLYGVQLIQDAMSRNRFEEILRFFHLADNDNSDPTDRLAKINPLIKLVAKNFEKYTPGEKVVIDESLVRHRGRTILRQYIPDKKSKYGLKFYKICSPEGYTWRFKLYRGKGDTGSNLPHAEAVVLSLMEGLLNEGRTLYIDNFYSSVPLAKGLLQKSTYVCGTLRKNRKFLPQEVIGKKLKKGETHGKQTQNGLKIIKWMDKREVLMLTTDPNHSLAKVATGKKNRGGVVVEKPLCILDYNTTKQGVDISDQMNAYYSTLRKTRKWYKKAAFELLFGTSITNAYVLFNKYHTSASKSMSIKEFRESLVLSLLTDKPTEEIPVGNQKANIGGIRCEHVLCESDGKTRDVRKRCRGCYDIISKNEGFKIASSKARRVKTFCNLCEGKPFMCPSCFARLHEQ